jgi:hypothetical protein
MATSNLPPCGLYRTKGQIGDIPAGRLVYFHNHGDPGPGVYLPSGWTLNRAEFDDSGFTLPQPLAKSIALLDPLPEDGFYRVTESFFCCEKRCRNFEAETFVQLGYNGDGEAILFVPELTPSGIAIPDSGVVIGADRFKNLAALKLAEDESETAPPSSTLH